MVHPVLSINRICHLSHQSGSKTTYRLSWYPGRDYNFERFYCLIVCE